MSAWNLSEQRYNKSDDINKVVISFNSLILLRTREKQCEHNLLKVCLQTCYMHVLPTWEKVLPIQLVESMFADLLHARSSNLGKSTANTTY